jgi:DNA invertase Pin-like site-specific DNA recombinase
MRKNNTGSNVAGRPKSSLTAVGYVRVSTDMQASDGLSLDAQRQAIRDYCAHHGLKLSKIYDDVESGGRADRPGLAAALSASFDVFVVLKFDRLSRSIKHFCEVYEKHFASGSGKELVAIREAIRLDSALGRALVSILLVFAQMEREATGERTKEAISYIRRSGYHFGKVPYGHRTVPAPENPRYRILVDDPAEQAILAQIKAWLTEGWGLTQIAAQLTADGVEPPQGAKWTKSLIYNLKVRKGWHTTEPANARTHTDDEVKAYMRQLRDRGCTYQSIANILNEQGYKPYKGKRFSESSVCRLLGNVKETQVFTPRTFAESMIARAGTEGVSLQKLATALGNAGFLTPRGNTHWWPAQVRQLLSGSYDTHYKGPRRSPLDSSAGLALAG